ncbi:MAG: PIG-L family deacetylase [Planctomycetota bacterium]|nr:PIG-L family deacetylase [Planctomycetota bacterium]
MNIRPHIAWFLLALVACTSTPKPGQPWVVTQIEAQATGPRVLGVYAHPDDETSAAAILYKTRAHLEGVCDLLLITNGEGGFKYSTLAEDLYGAELTDEPVGRALLPAIRRDEFLDGCALMQIRAAYFLEETDHRYSTDPEEVLAADAGVWNLDRIEDALVERMTLGRYDFILTLAPTPQTHGHHQAATILALRAAARLPADQRPAVLCARQETADGAPDPPAILAGYPETALAAGVPPLIFDRTQPFGHRGRLDYRVLVNWVIAAHKSQGTMQLAMSRGLRTHLFLFALSPAGSAEAAQAWLEGLAQPQFTPRVYGSSAGTNASSSPPKR